MKRRKPSAQVVEKIVEGVLAETVTREESQSGQATAKKAVQILVAKDLGFVLPAVCVRY